jgi:hypothetical protein
MAFAYGFHAPSYRAELSRLAALGVEVVEIVQANRPSPNRQFRLHV